MPQIIEVRGHTPSFGKDCWLADNAVITGDVVCGDECSLWFHTVIRGDVNRIRIGNRVNVQDGTIIHCTFEKTETHIGDEVSIGHRAIVHGCTIESRSLIGMGAIVMDSAHIPSNCIVAAGALVPEGRKLESGWIYAGIPARKLKPVDADDFDFLVRRTAENYVKYAGWYL